MPFLPSQFCFLHPSISIHLYHVFHKSVFSLSLLNTAVPQTKCGAPEQQLAGSKSPSTRPSPVHTKPGVGANAIFGQLSNLTTKEKDPKQNRDISSLLPWHRAGGVHHWGSPFSVCLSLGILWLLLFPSHYFTWMMKNAFGIVQLKGKPAICAERIATETPNLTVNTEMLPQHLHPHVGHR